MESPAPMGFISLIFGLWVIHVPSVVCSKAPFLPMDITIFSVPLARNSWATALMSSIVSTGSPVTWWAITDAGLVATPSPGSIFAYLAMTPKGWHFQVLMGVLIGAVASFFAGWLLLKRFPVKEVTEELEEEELESVPGL